MYGISEIKGERQESVRVGKKMLEEQLSVLGYKMSDKIVSRLLDGYEIFEKNADELYFRVGIGLLKLNNLDEILKNVESKGDRRPWNFNWFRGKDKEREKNSSYVINDVNDTKHKYVIANCCNPIPGDSVVGFLASDGTITVHKKSCPVANSIAAKHGDRIVVPEWKNGETATSSFLVRLSLKGFDRLGIINEISRYISLVMSVNIRRFCLGTEGGVFEGYIDLYVHDKDDLEKLIKKLNKIEGIQSVVRTDL